MAFVAAAGAAALAGAATLTGCGGNSVSNDPARPGNPDAYEDRSQQGGPKNACSHAFLTEYNAIATAARNDGQPLSTEQLNQIKAEAQAFRKKYDGVKCAAMRDGNPVTVDATAWADDLVAEIDRDLAGGGANSGL
jgi:hypothetical protein